MWSKKEKTMNIIKFTHNWNNKLEQQVFTTIRRWNHEKQEYYEQLISEPFDVLLKGTKVGVAELHSVQVVEFSQIPKGLIMMDTGLREEHAYDIFSQFGLMTLPNNKAIILTFVNHSIKKA